MSAWLAVRPPSSPAAKHRLLCNSSTWLDRTLVGAFSGVLSFGLFISSPSSAIALQTPSIPPPPLAPSEICREVEPDDTIDTGTEVVTNEGLVEEAWKIVSDSFLDARGRRWSQDSWLQKREDILSNSIQTRSKAHQIIKRMLASLGDPYTRFLSPEEFSKMARYDMTGIGINLREVPDENGITRMKVLGIILDGPAHSSGVRQGDEILAVNGVEVQGKSAFEVSSLLQGPNETFSSLVPKYLSVKKWHTSLS